MTRVASFLWWAGRADFLNENQKEKVSKETNKKKISDDRPDIC